MKILFATFVAICAFALNCSAQWSHAGTNVFLSTITDYVGIGTGTPPTKLTVLDSVNALQLRLGGVIPSLNPAMRWTGRNAANTTNRSADIQLDADAGIFNFFAPSPSTPVVKAMSILTGGNVGIGTTAPSNLLEVSGANTTPLTLTRTTAASNVSVEFKNGTASWFAGQGSNGNFGIATSNDVGASTAFNVTPAGNVGIGTTAPADKLEVSGNILLSRGADRTFGIPDPTTSTVGNNLTIRASSGGTGGAARVGGNLNLTAGAPYSGSALNGASGNVVITAGGNTGAGSGGGAIMFQTGKATAETMRIDALGNVGIGTTSPSQLLEVSGASGTDGSTTPTVKVTSTTNSSTWTPGATYAQVDFSNNDASGLGAGATKARIAAIAPEVSGTNTDLAFYASNTSNLSETMRITASNRVGIGTSIPSAKLEVLSTTENIRSSYDATNYMSINTASTGSTTFSVTGTSPAFGFTGGNVGIGTSNPTKKLEIANNTLPAFRLNNTSTSVAAGGSFGEFDFYANDASAGGVGITGFVKSVAVNSGVSSALTFGTRTSAGGDAAEVMRIGNTGNVGIGTANPDQKLTVAGQVHSTSVVVTSTVPADYVFNNDYRLRPLADVKAFVDKNHHLPEVPSAADFKKDGQNLGEMNMTLLKKVEELTLYMIEQNKKTAELTEKVKAQQEEIERLKKGNK